ncbi:MAG: hypothetical protein EOO68_04985, partial [Moraxellaceae bacterium]
DTDIAFFAAGREISRIYIPKATEQNTIVIDNSSYFRMDDDVPLVIPEVNIEDLPNYKKRNIISNPNCSLIQLLIALKKQAISCGSTLRLTGHSNAVLQLFELYNLAAYFGDPLFIGTPEKQDFISAGGEP